MKTKETFLKIDPPSGWKYGFPKTVTQKQYKEIKNLKQWCIDNGYPKEEADSYGDYFCIQINGDLSFMNNEKTTRQQAMAWWNKLKYDSPLHLEFYAKKYFQRDWDTLTGREIEEIWLKETQDVPEIPIHLKPNQKQYSQEENEKEYIQKVGRVNRKQFKQFDESLFKAYTDKLPHNEIGTMIGILSRRLNKSELIGVIEALKIALNYK